MMKRETYYWTCPYCGANLDPDETCDCRKDSDEDVKDYKAVQDKEEPYGAGGYTFCHLVRKVIL